MQAAPEIGRQRGGQQRAVRVYAALGPPGGARGVGQQAQVVGRPGYGQRAPALAPAPATSARAAAGRARSAARSPSRARPDPWPGPARRHRCAPRRAAGGHRPARGASAGSSSCATRATRRRCLRCSERARRGAHGVDRHHHCAAAQDGVEGNGELRAVLAHQQHAVAVLHLGAALQVAGQRVGLGS